MSHPLDTLPVPRFLGTLFTKSVAVIVPCLIIFTGLCFKLGLWEVVAPFIILFLSFGAIATVLIFNRFKMAVIPAGLAIVWVSVQTVTPTVADSARTMAHAQQERFQQAAHDSAFDVPTAIVCDRTTADRIVFFAMNTSTDRREARTWYSESDGRCWDGPGVHPQTGEKLVPVTPAIVERIKKRPPEGTSDDTRTAHSENESQWGETYTYVFTSRP